MMEEKKYHITIKENIDKIMSDGLIPMIGENSRLALEEEPMIYLCDEESMPYWLCFLGIYEDSVIKVDVDDTEICRISDDTGSTNVRRVLKEYRVKTRIPPSRLHKVKNPVTQEKYRDVMKELCFNAIRSISYVCLECAQYYTGTDLSDTDDDETNYMLGELQTQAAILDRLDFTVVSLSEMKDYLREYGEFGEYTYDDWYCRSKYKLHQMLTRYPEDSLAPARKALRRVINRKLKGTLTMNTGGWNG